MHHSNISDLCITPYFVVIAKVYRKQGTIRCVHFVMMNYISPVVNELNFRHISSNRLNVVFSLAAHQ